MQGKNQRVVWTGSQNLTSNGSLYNDDMILRVVGTGYYFAYSRNFSYIQTKSKRLRKTPPPIVLKSKRRRRPDADAGAERRASGRAQRRRLGRPPYAGSCSVDDAR